MPPTYNPPVALNVNKSAPRCEQKLRLARSDSQDCQPSGNANPETTPEAKSTPVEPSRGCATLWAATFEGAHADRQDYDIWLSITSSRDIGGGGACSKTYHPRFRKGVVLLILRRLEDPH